MSVITNQLVLDATNAALHGLKPAGSLPSLSSDKKSDKAWSCNNFGPATLEQVITASKGKEKQTTYQKDPQTWPKTFPPKTFVNFMVFYKDSSLNHNFNVYVESDNASFLIQAYLDHTIRISTPHKLAEFISLWHELGTDNWAKAYEKLFYVKPQTQANLYDVQYVTVVTGS